MLAGGEAGTALLLEWDNFRALIPGGVSQADLPQIAGCTLLVLEDAVGADWNAAQTRLTWRAGEPAFQIETDGRRMWVNNLP